MLLGITEITHIYTYLLCVSVNSINKLTTETFSSVFDYFNTITTDNNQLTLVFINSYLFIKLFENCINIKKEQLYSVESDNESDSFITNDSDSDTDTSCEICYDYINRDE